jgi:transcriptional regulator with XRE-family HTH domain
MTVEQVRSRNFQLLFQQFKEEIWRDWPKEPERGMLKKFAECLGMNKTYLSQINNDSKIIGTETRDKIEKARGLEKGWMDQDHTTAPANELERAFIESALTLFRKSPSNAQSELLRAFSQHIAQ